MRRHIETAACGGYDVNVENHCRMAFDHTKRGKTRIVPRQVTETEF